MATLTNEGNFFMFNFNSHRSSEEPFYYGYKMKGKKTSDFTFLNRDSVIASVGVKPNFLEITDVLIPDN